MHISFAACSWTAQSLLNALRAGRICYDAEVAVDLKRHE